MGKKKVAEPGSTPAVTKPAAAPAAEKSAAPVSKKVKRLESARVYVKASYNNTIVTVADTAGNVVTWTSAGAMGFSGPKKATPFAASKLIAVIAEKLKALGVQNLEVYLTGIGGGRDSAVRSLVNHGFNITVLKDVTPIPHNGPRPRKVRRV